MVPEAVEAANKRADEMFARLRDFEESALRKDMELELRLTKEVASKNQAHSELKNLRQTQDADIGEMRAIEAEVVALVGNFEEGGTYWQMMQDEMAELRDENYRLQDELNALNTSQGWGLDAELADAELAETEHVDQQLRQLTDANQALEEQLATERRQHSDSEQSLKQQAEELRLELERVSVTLTKAAAQERVLEQTQLQCTALETAKSSAELRISAVEQQVEDLQHELSDTKKKNATLAANMERAKEATSPLQVETLEQLSQEFSNLMSIQRQRGALFEDLQLNFNAVNQDAQYHGQRVVRLAETAIDMQTSLTTTSTTCKSMNSFVGRIWNPRTPSRIRGSSVSRLKSSPRTPIRESKPSSRTPMRDRTRPHDN